ncbi:uncharacterized protein TRIADDRAFT_57869 [Trichoplax adhaerens]|uniref:Lipase domain-containing protein n=1 Tax=Trichoplax adhaerens TaxID=10228 RepID=B3S1S6_TRIAD|nr:hypothetical protein TRIADDRAFT_57869 [Trichoplax adhaerens]EDV23026.1 hypothetical protein TRIADDRAFT_57869 [Trichoplax adhaerens]|eukprot:XP_002113936.1 hypothetical protein TRIADDRAFT_57869 [Trichoplax adhaerens]
MAETCDPDQKLGCYSNTGPWSGSDLPQSSTKIGTKFYLYTCKCNTSHTLDYNNPASISNSSFNGNIDTKIIIHGFSSSSSEVWVHKMKDAFLTKGCFNVILVDWRKGAESMGNDFFIYFQPVANTRVVGDQIAELVKALPTSKSRIHLIGHSLGAHVSSFASVRLNKAARISGLDPAGPKFVGLANAVKLDKTDADFVDIIHSDAGTFGTTEPSGHLDFWPNNGVDQPQCNLFDDAGPACDHSASHVYYTESINSDCNFVARPCSNYGKYKSGGCTNCFYKYCPVMGYRAIEFKKYYFYGYEKYTLFLTTNEESPYCAGNKPGKRWWN